MFKALLSTDSGVNCGSGKFSSYEEAETWALYQLNEKPDGYRYVITDLTKDTEWITQEYNRKRKDEYEKAGISQEALLVALWEHVIEGRPLAAGKIQKLREAVKSTIPSEGIKTKLTIADLRLELELKVSARLRETDVTQIADYPMDTKLRSEYREYRKFIRSLPELINRKSWLEYRVPEFEEWVDWDIMTGRKGRR